MPRPRRTVPILAALIVVAVATPVAWYLGSPVFLRVELEEPPVSALEPATGSIVEPATGPIVEPSSPPTGAAVIPGGTPVAPEASEMATGGGGAPTRPRGRPPPR